MRTVHSFIHSCCDIDEINEEKETVKLSYFSSSDMGFSSREECR
jgi:hypothetical protein